MEAVLKIIFTASKNPNFFSKMISAIEKTPYSHVVIDTGTSIQDERLVLHSQWNKGLTLDLYSVVVGNKNTHEFEIADIPFDWDLAIRSMKKHTGFENYGWAQIAGHVFRLFHLKEPKWIASRYSNETYCSEIVLLHLQKRGLFMDLNPNTTGPGELFRALQNHLTPTGGENGRTESKEAV